MKRREFITLLASAAAWPWAAAHAQQSVKRVGVILSGSEDDPEMQVRVSAVRQGLAALGWVEGRDFRFEYRWPAGNVEREKVQAVELVALAPDVIVVGAIGAALTLKRETQSIPIVFGNLADPVGNGIIPSLAKTGGNITGFTAFEFTTAGKWLELLKEISPRISRVAVVFGGPEMGPTGERFYKELQVIAPSVSVELTPIRIRDPADIEPAIDSFAAAPNGGLITMADGGTMRSRPLIIGAAARHHLPAVYPFRVFADEGGLAVYGVDVKDQYRRVASYIDRILKGAKPADLPVQAPDKFELIINLKAAREQGIEIPPLLLTRADEVIE
jgi:putative ABC transport system substrate-binding protein